MTKQVRRKQVLVYNVPRRRSWRGRHRRAAAGGAGGLCWWISRRRPRRWLRRAPCHHPAAAASFSYFPLLSCSINRWIQLVAFIGYIWYVSRTNRWWIRSSFLLDQSIDGSAACVALIGVELRKEKARPAGRARHAMRGVGLRMQAQAAHLSFHPSHPSACLVSKIL